MKKGKIIYITETSLPSNSANIINSLKFCDSLKKFNDLIFLLPNFKIKKKIIYSNYNLKNKIKFKSILNQNILGKFDKLIFLFKILSYLNENYKKGDYIIGRSIFCSIFLSFLNKKNTLEIHHNITGFSKFFFKMLMLTSFKKNISFILINRSLIRDLKIYNQKYIILDDGADILNKKNNNFFFKKSCVYIGSFYQGKGIEIISELSKILPGIDFHIYGDFSVLKDRNFIIKNKNIILKKKLKYSEVHSVLKRYHIALMPYQNRVMVKSQNLEISKYISPLKMFDYLAAGNIIIASRLKAYGHILKNNLNAVIISNRDLVSWKRNIYKILANPSKYNYMKKNALKTAKNYSWEIRAKKFLKFLNN